MKNVVVILLMGLVLTSCNEEQEARVQALESRVEALESTPDQIALLEARVQELTEQNATLLEAHKNLADQQAQNTDASSALKHDQDNIFSALEEQEVTVNTLGVRVDLLEVNEDQQDQREILLSLDEEKRHLQMIRSSVGTRIMMKLLDAKHDAEEGGITASVQIMNPESGNQKGLKFLTRAYTHLLVEEISAGKEEKPYNNVELQIDLPPGSQTVIDLFIPWTEEDSPIEAIQLKDFTLESYGMIEEE